MNDMPSCPVCRGDGFICSTCGEGADNHCMCDDYDDEPCPVCDGSGEDEL